MLDNAKQHQICIKQLKGLLLQGPFTTSELQKMGQVEENEADPAPPHTLVLAPTTAAAPVAWLQLSPMHQLCLGLEGDSVQQTNQGVNHP